MGLATYSAVFDVNPKSLFTVSLHRILLIFPFPAVSSSSRLSKSRKDSQDSPDTAIRRKEITTIKHRHRAQVRDSQRNHVPAVISQTPLPLFLRLPRSLPQPRSSFAFNSPTPFLQPLPNFFDSSPLLLPSPRPSFPVSSPLTLPESPHRGPQSEPQSSFNSSLPLGFSRFPLLQPSPNFFYSPPLLPPSPRLSFPFCSFLTLPDSPYRGPQSEPQSSFDSSLPLGFSQFLQAESRIPHQELENP
jgi:hypothetical protein